MSDVAISVEGLSKRYVLQRDHSQSDGLRHAMENAFRSPLMWLRHRKTLREHDAQEFWALKMLTFQVKRGEVVGVIGRNGAGKSTLLKVLSRITEPTSGRIVIDGRVASLLEVGTGFHADLTGRENIYLNGAILGMSRAEIRSKFDEIVAFSEVEAFIDTPVKRYSSGMYVRLAFAVAAHLQPEILIVDEVLAVGDVQFQKKCLGKLRDVSRSGRTVLLVSHNMQSVIALCDSAIWLEKGTLRQQGSCVNVVNQYHAHMHGGAAGAHRELIEKERTGTGAARFVRMKIVPVEDNGDPLPHITPGCAVKFELDIRGAANVAGVNVAITISDLGGYRLVDINTAAQGGHVTFELDAITTVIFTIKELLLKPGQYVVDLWLGRGGVENIDFVRDAAVFDVLPDPESVQHSEEFPGVYKCRFEHSVIVRDRFADQAR